MNIESSFYLYHTLGCHLCDDAEAIVRPIAEAEGVSLIKIDIADAQDLMDKYATSIPVLHSADTQEDLNWPFSHDEAAAFIKEQQCP